MTQTHWTLAETLRRNGKNVSALVKASGLSKNTVYDIVNGKSQAVTLETLDKLLSGLEELTQAPVTLEDVLSREQGSDIDPELLAQLSGIQPFNWADIKRTLPDWTPEEQAENERMFGELEEDRRSRGDTRMQKLEALWEELDTSDDGGNVR